MGKRISNLGFGKKSGLVVRISGDEGFGRNLGFGRRDLAGIWVLVAGFWVLVVRILGFGRRFGSPDSDIWFLISHVLSLPVSSSV